MADVPERHKPENTNSLAEMAARAAQRAANSRPPPPPVPLHPPSEHPGFAAPSSQQFGSARSFAPPDTSGYASNRSGGSGLIHLQSLQPVSNTAPVLQHVDLERMSAPPSRRRAHLESNPFESKGSRGLLVGFIVGLLVIGGAYGLALKRGINPVAAGRNFIVSLRHSNAPAPAAPLSVNDTPTKIDATASRAGTTRPVAESPSVRGLDPSRLPAAGAITPEATDALADAKAPRAAAKAAPKTAAENPTPRAEPAAKAAPAARAPEPKSEPAQVAQAPQAPEPTGLAGAIKKAVGPTDRAEPVATPETPVPAVRGDIPETPPQGAIQGAIGSNRTAARACVDGYDAASRATIVFSSSGKVENVNVAGPAAGTKAEACIVRVLSKAAVGPFRRATFSVTTTISPP